MDASLLSLLYIAVFGAALLQAATGIGYGVIAGPIFLVVLNGVEAFQISAIHNILIAVLVAPFVFKNFSGSVLRPLLFGIGLLRLKMARALSPGWTSRRCGACGGSRDAFALGVSTFFRRRVWP